MIYTPLSHHTDRELIQMVVNSTEPTWLELELMQRLEAQLDEAEAEYDGVDCEKIYGVAI